ncbi:MAG: DUF3656 domain-containing protein, partial [Muribaculaceae bacterium]|nr:DUF3656 domain-containing protein [Muribaculaceae bacterium]
TPDLGKSFNRGFTDYFLHADKGVAKYKNIASLNSPKSLGEYVGVVKNCTAKGIESSLATTLVNGDGLSYITNDEKIGGFRVNRTDGKLIYPAERIILPTGTKLYRSHDKAREEMLSRPTAKREIPIEISISRHNDDSIALTGRIEGVGETVITATQPIIQANNNPREHRQRQLMKWGDTIFAVEKYEDNIGEEFVPASILTDMRRRLAEALISTLSAQRVIARATSTSTYTLPTEGKYLDYRTNVSNKAAQQFYKKCGVEQIEPAIEVAKLHRGKALMLMETRYCLRREIGACLKEGGEKLYAEPLTLRGQGFEMRLEFDCKNCKMRVNCIGK